MLAYKQLEERFTGPLRLERRPVAVTFRETPPPGISRFTGSVPAGCSFWRIAAEGRAFYTVPGDHYNCPVGSYTHNIALPPERAADLDQVLGLMTGAGYIKIDEIPTVFRMPVTPVVIIYAPLGQTPVEPDVVLFVARPASVMLLEEAAMRAGVADRLSMLGRPTCMAIPAAIAQGTLASSGCIGNRTYTGLGDDEMYVAVPGRDLERIAAEVEIIVEANRKLAEFHRDREERLTR